MQTPLVSVITPTYNRAHTLGNAINCVLAKTYQDWGLLIVDDGSTDKIKELVGVKHMDRIFHYDPLVVRLNL
jgi:glycosyltransferase involved in cell wall biosynthesis